MPALTFSEYQVFSHLSNNTWIADSAYLSVTFQDGDGDLGTSDSTKMSLYMDYYEDQGSGFVALPQFNRAIYLPRLTPEGNHKGIEGTITQFIKPAPIFNIFTTYPYQWKIYVVDQKGNKSNVVETPSQSK